MRDPVFDLLQGFSQAPYIDGFEQIVQGVIVERIEGVLVVQVDGNPLIAPSAWASFFLSVLRPISNPWLTVTQFQNPTFISHVSSLDIRNSTSMFDQTIIPANTGFHHIIPNDIVDDIVNALIQDHVYVLNRTYNNEQRIVAAGIGIYAGKNVSQNSTAGDVTISGTSDITFKAGQEISLQAGFNVLPGAVFTGVIGNVVVACDGLRLPLL